MTKVEQENLRVLVVDDTSLYRNILSNVLSGFSGVEVVGTANNGKIAMAKIAQLKPDIVTLDVEMPEMDGIETLRQLKVKALHLPAIMVSAHTIEGARITMEALELGAFDFIEKPDGDDHGKNIENLQSQLKPKINAFINKKHIRSMLKGGNAISKPVQTSGKQSDNRVSCSNRTASALAAPVKIVTIGISTGGPNALAYVIPKLPKNSPPVVIVQHMPPVFTAALAESLDKKSSLTVVEGKNGHRLQHDNVYIAPGGKQMKVENENNEHRLSVTDDPPECHCKPSADYLFRSVAKLYKNHALGVIMTGMGSDGTLGLRLMKRQCARIIAQDEESCTVFGMPMEAIKAGVVDIVLPLEKIADEIIRKTKMHKG